MIPVTALSDDLIEGDRNRTQIGSSDSMRVELCQVVERLEAIAVTDSQFKVLRCDISVADAFRTVLSLCTKYDYEE